MAKHRKPYLNAEGVLVRDCTVCEQTKPVTLFHVRGGKCRECYRAKQREWESRNPEIFAAYSRNDKRKVMGTPRGRLDNRIKTGINNALRRNAPSTEVFRILGFSVADLKANLESTFDVGMSWENYGRFGWHIEHRVPVSAFDYQTEHDPSFKLAWALTNIRALWWRDNLQKAAKIIPANDNEPQVVKLLADMAA